MFPIGRIRRKIKEKFSKLINSFFLYLKQMYVFDCSVDLYANQEKQFARLIMKTLN